MWWATPTATKSIDQVATIVQKAKVKPEYPQWIVSAIPPAMLRRRKSQSFRGTYSSNSSHSGHLNLVIPLEALEG